MIHKASAKFWKLHDSLPDEIQSGASKAFDLLKRNPRHPSLHFKRLGGTDYWSARVNDDYRAMAVCVDKVWTWFWIGPHEEYTAIIKGK